MCQVLRRVRLATEVEWNFKSSVDCNNGKRTFATLPVQREGATYLCTLFGSCIAGALCIFTAGCNSKWPFAGGQKPNRRKLAKRRMQHRRAGSLWSLQHWLLCHMYTLTLQTVRWLHITSLGISLTSAGLGHHARH
jgi:hypothetical protein